MTRYKTILFLLIVLLLPLQAQASQVLTEAVFLGLDSNGALIDDGGYINTYECGTTTAKTTYSDAALSVDEGSQRTIGSDGRVADPIYFSGCIRYRLYDSDDTLLDDQDDIYGMGATAPSGINLSDYASLDAMLDAITGLERTIHIDTDVTAAENETFEATHTVVGYIGNTITDGGFTLVFNGPVYASKDMFTSTGTLTFNSEFDAGDYRVFTAAGTVTFESGICRPEWFGAVRDDAASTDDDAAIEKCIDTVPNGGRILLSEGEYDIDDITFDDTQQSLEGVGRGASTLAYTETSGNIIKVTANNVRFRHLSIQGPGTGGTENAVYVATPSHFHMEFVNIGNVGNNCLYLDSFYTALQAVHFTNAGDDIIDVADNGGSIVISDGSYLVGEWSAEDTTSTDSCIAFSGGVTNFGIRDSNIEGCTYGIYANTATAAPKALSLDNVHFEGNVTSDIRLGNGTQVLTANACRFGGNAGETTTLTLDFASASNLTAYIDAWFSQIGYNTNFISVNDATQIKLSATTNIDASQVLAGEANFVWDFPMLDNAVANVSTSGTGEDDLESYVFSDVACEAGSVWLHGVHILAAGTKTGANDNKTIKLYIGAASYTVHAAANNTNDWRAEATLIFRDGDTQTLTWKGFDGATVLQGYEAPAQDFTAGDITIKMTGECANASDTITQTIWVVEAF